MIGENSKMLPIVLHDGKEDVGLVLMDENQLKDINFDIFSTLNMDPDIILDVVKKRLDNKGIKHQLFDKKALIRVNTFR